MDSSPETSPAFDRPTFDPARRFGILSARRAFAVGKLRAPDRIPTVRHYPSDPAPLGKRNKTLRHFFVSSIIAQPKSQGV
jgi:hypothetical protein